MKALERVKYLNNEKQRVDIDGAMLGGISMMKM